MTDLDTAREKCVSFLKSERARGASIVPDIVEPYIAELEAALAEQKKLNGNLRSRLEDARRES
jgi:hypothetical protein